MYLLKSFIIAWGAVGVYAATATTSAVLSSITGCHSHGADILCFDQHGDEVRVEAVSTSESAVPAQYTGCHEHGTERFCFDSRGNEVLVKEESGGEDSAGKHDERHDQNGHTHDEGSDPQHDHSAETDSAEKKNCHFHAGVEHCVAAEVEEHRGSSCNIQVRDYDVPLRIGTLFVVLITSAVGVFAPILLSKLPFTSVNAVFSTVIKQFGTGIIVATAFVHLYTHSSLMFANQCLGELEYEATASAIVIAGIFLAFLIEFIGYRMTKVREEGVVAVPAVEPKSQSKDGTLRDSEAPAHQESGLLRLGHSHGCSSHPSRPPTKFSVLIMEAGVLFHSILIGLTLVVAGNSFYKTLLVVIIFHQFFEGLALGARIATLSGPIFPSKAVMAGAFAMITPLGMAIGLGVLHIFNGNAKGTLIALGTLDALSAGILVWVGVVDMWARDWVIEGGEMLNASLSKALTGGAAFVTGLVLMGLLGKWA
ncbi:hypothetical protein N7539_006567 [Penicillium diatomitis]|uniref:ZIP Zinc transporter n=1 Tax=Penicillium diatomitis TaxID=2819901 RepID=A0A9W9X1J2_9EURO|nr:uncharacterized protein N7539_006567 [Penicillium diatomitis]KAJ5480673.1 hypothetical protein N7539_006567 [Penicillium diatomitis]